MACCQSICSKYRTPVTVHLRTSISLSIQSSDGSESNSIFLVWRDLFPTGDLRDATGSGNIVNEGAFDSYKIVPESDFELASSYLANHGFRVQSIILADGFYRAGDVEHT